MNDPLLSIFLNQQIKKWTKREISRSGGQVLYQNEHVPPHMVLDAISTSRERGEGVGCSMTGYQTGYGVIKLPGVSFSQSKRPPAPARISILTRLWGGWSWAIKFNCDQSGCVGGGQRWGGWGEGIKLWLDKNSPPPLGNQDQSD